MLHDALREPLHLLDALHEAFLGQVDQLLKAYMGWCEGLAPALIQAQNTLSSK